MIRGGDAKADMPCGFIREAAKAAARQGEGAERREAQRLFVFASLRMRIASQRSTSAFIGRGPRFS